MTKILLVEDDKSLREIYSVRLLAEGYTLISSGDGEEALAAAIGEKPDLIISDVMMPKISGFEMLDLLRSNDATKNIPVIMLTALSSEQQRERGNRLGADRYLIKSQVGIEDIVRTVHEVLGDGNQSRNIDQMQTSVETSAVHPAGATSNTNPTTQATSPLFPSNPTDSADNSATANNDVAADTANSADDTNPAPTLSAQSDASANSIAGLNLGGNDTSNFPALDTTDSTPTGPANFQSAFNPPAATEPSRVVGQPSPELPDIPMHIPSRTVAQPGMPNSYTAASQSVADSPFASLANIEPRRPTVNPVQRQSQPATQQQVQPQSQAPQQPVAGSTVLNQQAPQQQMQYIPTTTGQTVQQQLMSQGVGQPAAATQMQQQPMSQQQSFQTPVAQPAPQAMSNQPNQWGQAPMPSMVAQQPMQAQFIQQPNVPGAMTQSMQPVMPSARTPIGSERVVTPPPAGTSVSPRINIDELLASADASTGGSNMFPGARATK